MLHLNSRKLKLWKLVIAGLALTIAVFPLQNIISWSIILAFFLFVPGWLFVLHFNRIGWRKWETFSFSLGFSILILMMTGLLLNSLYYVGLQRPLDTIPIFIALTIVIAFLCYRIRKDDITLPHFEIKNNRAFLKHLAIIVPLSFLPIISAAGALRLNNGASNILTLIMFALIAAVFVFLIIKTSLANYYPFALVMFALAILFSISLRGWGITGHDIQHEFNVFQLTMRDSFWNIEGLRDTYNACLSITILPTMLAKVTGIYDPYIYKIVFQLIFAVAVIPVYSIAKRFGGATFALLAGFLFVSFPTFLNDMPMLNRQEIAFLFFGMLLLLMMLNVERRQLFVLTGFVFLGLTLSHYSTTYVTLGLLIIAWFLSKILVRLMKKEDRKGQLRTLPILNLPLIIIACIFVMLWNGVVTQTAGGLGTTVSKTFSSLLSGQWSQASEVQYILSGKPFDIQDVLENYAKPYIKGGVKVEAIDEQKLPVSSSLEAINNIVPIENINSGIRNGISRLFQILLVLGFIVLSFDLLRKPSSRYSLFILSVCGSGVALLILITVLPQLSVEYGLLRMFQQLLTMLSILILGAILWIFSRFIKQNQTTYIFAAGFISLIFLHMSGFIPQLTGGAAPQLALNNNGFQYDAYYSTDAEKVAGKWLCENRDNERSVAADKYAISRFLNNCEEKLTIASPMVNTDGLYVFNDGVNVAKNAYMINLNSNLYYFRVVRPTQEVNQIYSNGTNTAWVIKK